MLGTFKIMATYRHGDWIQHDGSEFYSIDKKVWYGWKEMNWWQKTDDGKKLMEGAVERLVEAGHTVI